MLYIIKLVFTSEVIQKLNRKKFKIFFIYLNAEIKCDFCKRLHRFCLNDGLCFGPDHHKCIYIILQVGKKGKFLQREMVLTPLIFLVDFTLNLISKLYYKCQRKEYHSLCSRYLRITRKKSYDCHMLLGVIIEYSQSIVNAYFFFLHYYESNLLNL